MTELMVQSSADPRFRATLVSLFAVVALLLAAIGLHGVVAFAVVGRAREIAIRVALGASATAGRGRVIGHAGRSGVRGLAIGLVGARMTGGVLSSLLYGITPSDPVSFAIVAAILLAVAVLASAVPARRATRIQPVEALRE